MKSITKAIIGTLATSYIAKAKQYYSGEIRTQKPFKYGKFKTRIQGSDQKGTVASLFTFWNGDDDQPWKWEEWNEIDIELVPSQGDWTLQTNLIYKRKQMDSQGLKTNPKDEWHDYELHWTPDYVRWFYDGIMVRSTQNTESVRDMNKDQLLYMNFWTPNWETWASGRDDSTMPWYTRYDYVEAYDYNVDTKEFTMRFRDDFNTLNHDIWHVVNDWTFPENSSKFMENHTYVEDGKLVFKLDKELGPPHPNPEPKPDPNPKPQPQPQPDPTPCPAQKLDYEAIMYGDPCQPQKHNTANCGSGCSQCHMSWPASDPDRWDSDEATCRCLPEQKAPIDYIYGKLASNEKAGVCAESCLECRWSWPKDDPTKWKSDALMARCMPDGVQPYNPASDNDGGDQQKDEYADWQPNSQIIYSNDCDNLYDQECGSNCTKCKWSWPVGDPKSWKSNDAACRCEAKKTFVWGSSCSNLTDGLCGTNCTECRKARFFDDPNSAETCRCKEWKNP